MMKREYETPVAATVELLHEQMLAASIGINQQQEVDGGEGWTNSKQGWSCEDWETPI